MDRRRLVGSAFTDEVKVRAGTSWGVSASSIEELEVTLASSQPQSNPAPPPSRLPADATGTVAVIFRQPHPTKAKWLGWHLQGTVALRIACSCAATESPSGSTMLHARDLDRAARARDLTAYSFLDSAKEPKPLLASRLGAGGFSERSTLLQASASSEAAGGCCELCCCELLGLLPEDSSLDRPLSHSCGEDSPKVCAFEARKTVRYCTLPGFPHSSPCSRSTLYCVQPC